MLDELRKIRYACFRLEMTAVSRIQNQYNLLNRWELEPELMPKERALLDEVSEVKGPQKYV